MRSALTAPAVADDRRELRPRSGASVRREQDFERRPDKRAAATAEERLGAAVNGQDCAGAIDHEDRVLDPIEQGFELPGERLGLPDGAFDRPHLLIRRGPEEQRREGGLTVPMDREQPRFDGHPLAATGGKREASAVAGRWRERTHSRVGE